MRKLKEKHHSRDGVLGLAALIVAIMALIVAVVGVAGAAPTQVIVHKGDIAPGAVTAKALAKGAVTAKKIRKKAVTAAKLADGAVQGRSLASGAVSQQSLGYEVVGTAALAKNAVTASQLAPGSVYGGSLRETKQVTTPIVDFDAIAHNGEWTPSNTEAALCAPGEKVIGSGFALNAPGGQAASWLQTSPIYSGDRQGMVGRISTDAGGTATAAITAVCLP